MLLIASLGVREVFWLALIPGVLAAAAFWLLVKQKKTEPISTGKSLMLSLQEQPGAFKAFLGAVLIFGIADFSHTLLIFFAVATLTPSMGMVGAAAAGAGLYLVRNIVYALLCYPFGWLGDRFGRRNMLAAGYALAVLTFVGFIFTPADLAAYALLFAMAGAFIAAEDTLEGAIAGELVNENRRGLGFGVLATANGIGDFISSAVVSGIWALIGFPAGFAFAALVGAIGTVALVSGISRKT
jgi:MFS family permease